MSLGTKQGITYYSDCKSLHAIVNPFIHNEVNMRHKGYFDIAWDQNDISFDNVGYGLQKTRNNQGTLFCHDASKLFSMTEGYVGMTMELPENIYGGIYYPLLYSNSLAFNEHVLWAVNMSGESVLYPGMYAALTPRGIEFTIWNKKTKFTLRDTFSNIFANISFNIEFVWKASGLNDFGFTDGYKATMVIRINGEDVVIGNPPLTSESISGKNFYMLETPTTYSNLNCIIKEIIIANERPVELIDEWQSSSSSSSSESD